MKPVFSVNSSFKIEKNGQCFLNRKRLNLLKAIHDQGSINAASKALNMSYQQAWHFIQDMNRLAPLPLITRQRGGNNGGGADLTAYGRRAIAEFDKLLKTHESYQQDVSKQLWLCFF